MIKEMAQKFWAMRAQFARYFVVGASGVVLDIGTLYLFKNYAHLTPVWAVVANQFILFFYIFFLNKYWAFQAKGATGKQAARFIIILLANYAIAVGWMFLFNDRLGINYLLARLMNIALSVAWNFLIYKFWVYADVHNLPATPLDDGRNSR